MILGAVLAGGRSSRFGSDKAAALLDGRTLLDRVIDALRPQVDALVICGREHAGLTSVPDRPGPDLGPLGGLNAALHHAAAHGFEAVVTVPCDTPFLPDDLVERLRTAEGAAYAMSIPVIGWWPSTLAGRLDDHLATGPDRSVRRWAAAVGAEAIEIGPLANINNVTELSELSLTFVKKRK